MDTEFYTKGYKVIRQILPKDVVDEQYKKAIDIEKSKFIDAQVPNALSFYNSPLLKLNHDTFLPIMEKETGLKLYKTYYYWRKYLKGAILRAHSDRPACEISVTLHVGGDHWSIWLMDFDENAIKLDLKPGDALIYRGCQLSHWRGKFDGDICVQAFYHYVDMYGVNRLHKDDAINKGELRA